ncbi:MAG: CheR family methyltransferase [Legionella sp.]|nr:CheR family methyltransferase [Legionella sp.]
MMSNSTFNFKRLEKWAYDEYGLVLIASQQKKVALKIEQYLNNTQIKANDLFLALHAGDKEITEDMVDLLTIQESYFFRDASLFLFLKDEYLPKLIQEKKLSGNQSLTIWSAGCASGEELYSMAMLLVMLIPNIQDWKITLLGTDINKAALIKARQGLYSKLAFRSMDDKEKDKYFVSNQGRYQLIEPIKKMTKFDYGNIVEPPKFSGCVDLIFCRNVFIYFDEAAVDKALAGFDKALSREGVLFLGCSDFVRYHQKQFVINFKNSVTYLTKLKAKCTEEALESNPVTKPLSYVAQQEKRREQFETLETMLGKRDFKAVLEVVNKEFKLFNSNSMLYRYKGEALIGLGDVATAKAVLEEAVKKEVMGPICYFLLALLEMNKNKEKAEQYLTQAIYIKQKFPEAHYYLAMLYFGQQNKVLGLKCLEKAKHYAELVDAHKRVIGSNGDMSELMMAINSEIAHYQECEQ